MFCRDDFVQERMGIAPPGGEVSRKWNRSHRSNKKNCATTPQATKREEEAFLDDLDVEIYETILRRWFRPLGEVTSG